MLLDQHHLHGFAKACHVELVEIHAARQRTEYIGSVFGSNRPFLVKFVKIKQIINAVTDVVYATNAFTSWIIPKQTIVGCVYQ